MLEYCSKEIRFEREQYYISTLKPEYNLTLNVVANFGHKLSIETRLKISNTLKRRYAAGEIETYRQQHLWKTIYIYNIYNKTLAAKCKNQKEAFSLLKNKHKHVDKFKIYNLKYCLSYTEFVYVNDLTNYINKNLFTANSTFGKYIILESKDGELLYCRNLSECELICEKNKSTLSKHRNATKNNPYIIRENGFKFYYSNLYIPINIDTAVLVEKSLELQSGNIGEVCKDNTEINSEISQGSESSYSVGFE